jgi:hypothetical protein
MRAILIAAVVAIAFVAAVILSGLVSYGRG